MWCLVFVSSSIRFDDQGQAVIICPVPISPAERDPSHRPIATLIGCAGYTFVCMETESDCHRKGGRLSQQQSDLTDTVNFLYATVSLTNCVVLGPVLSEENRWIVQVTDYWIQTMLALKEVFHNRLAADAVQDELFSGPFKSKSLFNRDRPIETSERVGKVIQFYAGKLKAYLQTQHSWHDPYLNECLCCRCNYLQSLQQSTIQQLTLLESVYIPWQN